MCERPNIPVTIASALSAYSYHLKLEWEKMNRRAMNYCLSTFVELKSFPKFYHYYSLDLTWSENVGYIYLEGQRRSDVHSSMVQEAHRF